MKTNTPVAWYHPDKPNNVINAAQYPHVLDKNKVGYLPCYLDAPVPAGVQGAAAREPLTTKEIADLTAMVWGAPVADNDLKLAEFVIRAHEAILKTGERPKDPVDGGRFIEVPGAFGEGS